MEWPTKKPKIIHNTPEAIRRMLEVKKATAWYGREIVLKQENNPN